MTILDLHLRLRIYEYICDLICWSCAINNQRLIKHHMSCHVKSSARTWNMVCVSRSRSQEEYAGNRGRALLDSTRSLHQHTITIPNAVANRTGRPLIESNGGVVLVWDGSIDRVQSDNFRSSAMTNHDATRGGGTIIEQVHSFISEWHWN